MSTMTTKSTQSKDEERASVSSAPTCVCGVCGKESPAKKARTGKSGNNSWSNPNGWVLIEEKLYCRECRDSRYVVRVVSLPVSMVLLKGEPGWDTFRPIFKHLEQVVARLGNWAMSEFFVRDPVRHTPYIAEEKTALPEFKDPYLYGDPMSKAVAPGMSAKTRNEVLRQAWRLYKKLRLQIFLGRASTPTYRSPAPVPITGQGAKLSKEAGRHVLNVSLNGRRFKLVLAGGARHKRQTALLRRVFSGEVLARSYVLHELSAGVTQHRPLIGKGKRLICKIVVLMPKETPTLVVQRTLYVNSGDDVMFRYGCKDELHKRLLFNADHVRRRRFEHRERLNRLNQDKKAYGRGTKDRRDIQAQIKQECEKNGGWLNDFCHTTARMLVDFAIRQRVSRIEYDDSRRGYVTEFPWYKMAGLIREKAEMSGLTFVAIGDMVEQTAEPLAASQIAEL